MSPQQKGNSIQLAIHSTIATKILTNYILIHSSYQEEMKFCPIIIGNLTTPTRYATRLATILHICHVFVICLSALIETTWRNMFKPLKISPRFILVAHSNIYLYPNSFFTTVKIFEPHNQLWILSTKIKKSVQHLTASIHSCFISLVPRNCPITFQLGENLLFSSL